MIRRTIFGSKHQGRAPEYIIFSPTLNWITIPSLASKYISQIHIIFAENGDIHCVGFATGCEDRGER